MINEPHNDLVDQKLLNLHKNFRIANHKANDISNKMNDLLPDEDCIKDSLILENEYVSLPNYVSPILMTDYELNVIIRKFNFNPLKNLSTILAEFQWNSTGVMENYWKITGTNGTSGVPLKFHWNSSSS